MQISFDSMRGSLYGVKVAAADELIENHEIDGSVVYRTVSKYTPY